MLKLNKLYLPALLAILSACNIHPEHSITEISGNVIDEETRQPVANVVLDLTVAESIDNGRRLQNSIYYNTTSDAHGAYKFVFHDEQNNDQQLYRITPEKEGYVEVANTNLIATQLSEGKQNRADIILAKGSYLQLTVKQLPQDNADKSVELWVSHNIGDTGLKGSQLVTKYTALDAQPADTTLIYGYYFKQTPKVTLRWKVRSSGTRMTEQTHEAIVDLKEHNTTAYEINY